MLRSKYLQLFLLPFAKSRNKAILHSNPTVIPQREEANEVRIFVYNYSPKGIEEFELQSIEEAMRFKSAKGISWINIDGLRKMDVEQVCTHYGIHPLLIEDILSVNQRPKMDEIGEIMFGQLNMLYYNEKDYSVEHEQISIALGSNFVISFQEDASRDVFNPIREKLKIANSKVRQSKADYLLYTMLDMIVDNYFIVMEKAGERIEWLEEEIVRHSNSRTLGRINLIRKEIILLKRNIAPVRELINGFIKSENDLLEDRTTKYFKDVYDHIIQAIDLIENHRDLIMNLQDLYLSNVNLRMNEVMKVMAIVTCLLAPATVVGGIFGMNFDLIPYSHHQLGFYFAISFMLLIPIWMLWIFKRRGWF